MRSRLYRFPSMACHPHRIRISNNVARRVVLGCVGVGLVGCLGRGGPGPETLPARPVVLTVAEAESLVPLAPSAREGWARDIVGALRENHLPGGPEPVCAVVAIVQQESGFQANPVVTDLPNIVHRRLHEEAEKLGPLGRPALESFLEGRALGDAKRPSETFAARLKKVRTERDVDLVFRDLLAFEKSGHPFVYATADLVSGLSSRGRFEEMNPITTVGSMQVSVRFAVTEAQAQGRGLTQDEVRDALYTRWGGVFYGTARLLGYPVSYPKMLFRFADYNAGVYSSRNAALQAQVARMTGIALVPDGDLLAYDKLSRPLARVTESQRAFEAFRAEYAPEISPERLRSDLEHEKEAALEKTSTYRAVKRAFEAQTHAPAPGAQLPEVVIQSPKMKGERSTRWYAESVDRRFQLCLQRARALP